MHLLDKLDLYHIVNNFFDVVAEDLQ